ncbi:MAG: hypothetical protein IKL51_02465 [Lachnospiraceae bacterium]|nr:hypothetical protein [Lachnospiraceae bacterium]
MQTEITVVEEEPVLVVENKVEEEKGNSRSITGRSSFGRSSADPRAG